MSQITKQLAVRLPLDLHAALVASATGNNRSGHAEMLHRLEQSFEEQPVVDDAVVQQVFNAVATKVITEVFTTCFNRLEERVAAMLDHPMRHIYSVSIPSDNSDISTEDMSRMLKETHFPDYEFPLRRGTTSPTGRLSESQPEISGLHTLGSALPKRRLHSGGFTGLPAGELPNILEKGEPVIPLSEWEQRHGKGTRKGFPDPGPVSVTVLNYEGNQDSCPLTGQTWVITGSLETMTRDRAREIIMGLGGTVAGSVDRNTHAVVWGPGAGSKKARGEQLGIQQYTERQFIEHIRSHGVDMPLPKVEPLPEGEWIENTGDEPEGVTDKSILDFKLSTGNPVLGHHYLQGSSKGKKIWSIEGRERHVTHWRHSAYNRQQTFAEHVTSTPPKSPDQAVAEQLS